MYLFYDVPLDSPSIESLISLSLISLFADEEDLPSILASFKEFLQFFLEPEQGCLETGFHEALQAPLGTPRLSRQITFRC